MASTRSASLMAPSAAWQDPTPAAPPAEQGPGYSRRVSTPTPPPTGRRLPSVEERCAGGVVIDVHEGRARIAVIARRNRAGRIEWCLPKGHIEPGETLVQTAAREVAEETGITAEVLTELGTVDYWFVADDRRIHKVVHHYLLQATGGALGTENDPDGEAIDVAWFPLNEVANHLTFPNERRIAQAAWERLAGTA